MSEGALFAGLVLSIVSAGNIGIMWDTERRRGDRERARLITAVARSNMLCVAMAEIRTERDKLRQRISRQFQGMAVRMAGDTTAQAEIHPRYLDQSVIWINLRPQRVPYAITAELMRAGDAGWIAVDIVAMYCEEVSKVLPGQVAAGIDAMLGHHRVRR